MPRRPGIRAMPDLDATLDVGPYPMRRRDWFLVAVAIAPVVALIVVALVKVGHGYLGISDNGMTELRLSDIGRHWPLVGPFSLPLTSDKKKEVGANVWMYWGGFSFFGQYEDQKIAGGRWEELAHLVPRDVLAHIRARGLYGTG